MKSELWFVYLSDINTIAFIANIFLASWLYLCRMLFAFSVRHFYVRVVEVITHDFVSAHAV